MAEWSKAHDWKSCVPPKGTVSSNLTLSAILRKAPVKAGVLLKMMRESRVRTHGMSEFDYQRKADDRTPVGLDKADERRERSLSGVISLYPPFTIDIPQ